MGRQPISSPELEYDRLRRLFYSIIFHVIIMIRPLVAIGALVVLAAVAEASYSDDSYEDNKYDHDYKHEPQYYDEKYRVPTYKYDDEYGYEDPKYDEYSYEEHKYDHRPMYRHKTMKHYKYQPSYRHDYHYGDDSYNSYRHKRSTGLVGVDDMSSIEDAGVMSSEEVEAFERDSLGWKENLRRLKKVAENPGKAWECMCLFSERCCTDQGVKMLECATMARKLNICFGKLPKFLT